MEQRHRRTRTPDRQLDLLDPRLSSAPGATPGWNSLPAPTRRRLTELVARLLADHAGRAARPAEWRR